MDSKTCTWIDPEGEGVESSCRRSARYPGYRDVWSGRLCERHWARLRSTHETACLVTGCRSEGIGVGGYCRRHEAEPIRALPTEQRDALHLALVERIEPRGRAGCWMWTGRKNGDGYGVIDAPGGAGTWLAHRLVWSLFYEGHENGEWGNRIELDHLCTRQQLSSYHYGGRECVNPLHLNPATEEANGALRDLRAERPCYAWHAWSRKNPRPLSLAIFAMRYGLPMDPLDKYAEVQDGRIVGTVETV